MSAPEKLWFCPGCERVASEQHGRKSLLGQGCEGQHVEYRRGDLGYGFAPGIGPFCYRCGADVLPCPCQENA